MSNKNNYISDFKWLIAALTFVMIIMLPVLYFGIPSGHDLEHHFQCAIVFYNSILSGDWSPNWSASVDYGFGDVGARLYPPVGYYVLAVARIITGDWYAAGQTAFIFWMLLGATGMYLWARSSRLSPSYSALTSILYATAPYHLTRVYQLFLYAEFAAASILPFCFVFTARIVRHREEGERSTPEKYLDVLGFAVTFGILALTHIPLTLIATVGIILYGLLTTEKPFWREPQTVIKIFIGLGLGMMAAAWQWIKIATEMNWVNVGVEPQPEKYLYYKNHFFPLYFSTRENWYTARQLFLIDTIIVLTFLMLLVPVVSILIWRYKKRRSNPVSDLTGGEVVNEKLESISPEASSSSVEPFNGTFTEEFYRNLRALSVIGLFAFFFITLPSKFIWQVLPILQKIQFPWRWLSLVTIVSALGMVAGAGYLLTCGRKISRAVSYFLVILVLLIGLFDITQSILPLAAVDRAEFQKIISELPEGHSLIDWWTIWSRQEAFSDTRKAFVENAGSLQIIEWKNEEREFAVKNVSQPSLMRVATFYYPYWKAEINGEPADVFPGRDGAINLNIPSGDSQVRLFFQEPFKVRAAAILSGVTWILLLLSILALGLIKIRRAVKS